MNNTIHESLILFFSSVEELFRAQFEYLCSRFMYLYVLRVITRSTPLHFNKGSGVHCSYVTVVAY